MKKPRTPLPDPLPVMLPIDDRPGYWAGDDGHVYSTKGMRGPLIRLWEGIDNRGYRTVYLSPSIKVGERRHDICKVHKLVAVAFLGPRLPHMVTRHLDGDRNNNSAANLKYGTAQDNRDDSVRHGTQPRGESHGRSKMSVEDVMDIKMRLWLGESSVVLGREFGVTHQSIHLIRIGRNWAHI